MLGLYSSINSKLEKSISCFWFDWNGSSNNWICSIHITKEEKNPYRENFFNQQTEIGDATFYSSKENPNTHASFTNKNPENVKMNMKFTINGEPLSKE